MRAIIYERDGHVGVGAYDIAGRPLLIRQLQVLRDLGIEDVVVEVSEGPHASLRASLLLSDDPLVFRVTVVPSAAPLGVAELARRAGLAREEPFVALPADTLFSSKLELNAVPARYELLAPRGTHLPDAELVIESLAERASGVIASLEGWGARVTSESAAHQLGCAALSGVVSGILIHAAEIKPGVWAARGAKIADDAEVHAPLLLGVDAIVLGRARVGPRAIIGDRAVIERDATVADASVAADTIVGESTQLKHVRADARGMSSFSDGSREEVYDPLVLSARSPNGTALSSRLFALWLLVALALPWLCLVALRRLKGQRSVITHRLASGTLRRGVTGVGVLDVVPCLVDVVAGKRDLVGINDPRALEVELSRGHESPLRAGAIDISQRLAPGAQTSTLLRMWRWYAAHKNARLDLALCAARPVQKPRENR